MLNPVLWIHGEALGPTNPALVAYPGAPAVFVFDRQLIAQAGLSLKRLGFIYECLLELPVTLRHGDVAEEVLAFARRHRADGVATSLCSGSPLRRVAPADRRPAAGAAAGAGALRGAAGAGGSAPLQSLLAPG